MDHLIALLLMAAIPVSLVGLLYVLYVWYSERKQHERLLPVVAFVTSQIWFAGAYFCSIASIRLDRGLSEVPQWTQWLTAIIGFELIAIVGVKAIVLWRWRRKWK